MRHITTTFLLLCICSFSSAQGQNTSYPVRFAGGTVFFPDNFQAIRQNPGVLPEELVNGYYFRYIQCATIPAAHERAPFEAQGVQFLRYVDFGTYLAAIPAAFDLANFQNLRVRSVMPVKSDWKIARTLREKPFGTWAVHGNWIDVELQVYPQMRIDEAAQRFENEGYVVLMQGNQNGYLNLRIPQDRIEKVAALPYVEYLELMAAPGKPEDFGSQALHRSSLMDSDHPAGIHLNGTGVSTLVRDDGPIGPHVDFKGRLDNLGISPSAGDINHADWVGSCVGGTGNIDPSGKGMAAGALIYAQNYLASFQDETLNLHTSKNITITNTSYSNGCNVGYTLATQTVDQQLFDNPTLMHVFSAGNANGSDCDYGAGNQWGNVTGGHKMAKNSIAVANLAADGSINSSSSRGPAYDGRLKPEVAAHGTDVNMTQPDNTYSITSGTSFAAPNTAGCLAQLTQAYKEKYGAQPKASLLKAALMNTTNDLGQPGPDFIYGFGHINVYRAYQLLNAKNWVEGGVDQGLQSLHTLSVPNGTRQVRVMIYWVETPSAENAAKALINDLDLTVVSPNGTTINLPWRLDPTPDPVILDTPAGKGRDSLNNFEQVVIDAPAAGNYSIRVDGYAVPMGPQPYIIVWELLNDNVKLTYPAGGEGFTPGEKIRLQWDAYGTATNFTLRYSPDNGVNWNPITTLTGEKRAFEWTVPNTTNGQVRVLIIRGSRRDTTDFPVTISPIPADIKIKKVCPDSIAVSWTQVHDTLSYDVYLLGQKYMEVVGTSDTNFLTVPLLSTPLEDQWVSVATSHPNGMRGRRALAVGWFSNGQLYNCQQADDIGVRALSPGNAPVINCGDAQKSVTVKIVNEGLNALSGAVINYQFGNDPVQSEPLPVIAPGASLDFTFQNKISIASSGTYTLRVWSTYGPEDATYNDTLSATFLAVVDVTNTLFEETFEGTDFPPTGWGVSNPDNSTTWARRSTTVTGPKGTPTKAIWLDCFNYDAAGEEDYIYLVPMDLSATPNPGLRFDLAHANLVSGSSDALRVEVFANCDLNAAPTVVWEKSGSDLSTTDPTESSFFPNDSLDWRPEAASLKAFANQTVIVRLASTNEYGNNIFLDNVGLIEYDVTPPVATIQPSANMLCRLDTISLSAAIVPFATYNWSFGNGAQPASSATGPGPHEVRYLTAGTKNIRLIVTNPNGADTTIFTLPVLGNATANFTTSINGATVTFNNTSLYGESYLWDFGDTNTSTEASPVHTYALPGTYTVSLTAGNTCGTATSTKSQSITLTFVGTVELPEFSSIRVLPNPTESDFRAELVGTSAVDVQLSLLDAQGRLLKSVNWAAKAGVNTVPFEGLDLPSGTYQLVFKTAGGSQALSIIVQ